MTTINLKDFYPWYMTDEYIEVSDEVAAELRASKLAEAAYAERVDSCFSFQGKFFHFLTINRYGEIEYNLLYPASVFPFLREHLNSLDKGFHKLFLFRFCCGMVDFIKCQ